jgi:hypothetical protein
MFTNKTVLLLTSLFLLVFQLRAQAVRVGDGTFEAYCLKDRVFWQFTPDPGNQVWGIIGRITGNSSLIEEDILAVYNGSSETVRGESTRTFNDSSVAVVGSVTTNSGLFNFFIDRARCTNSL